METLKGKKRIEKNPFKIEIGNLIFILLLNILLKNNLLFQFQSEK